jgi:hypothetical protein
MSWKHTWTDTTQRYMSVSSLMLPIAANAMLARDAPQQMAALAWSGDRQIGIECHMQRISSTGRLCQVGQLLCLITPQSMHTSSYCGY